MTIAALRYQLTIESASATRGAEGGPASAFATVATIWCEPQPGRGREFFASRGLEQEQTCVFRVRYRTDLTTRQRASYDGKLYNIIEVQRERGLKKYLLLYCATGVKPKGV